MEPELTCCVSAGPKHDWMTGETFFGELKDGYCFKVDSSIIERYWIDEFLRYDCCSLTSGNNDLLNKIGVTIPFEIAIGMNGYVCTCFCG